MICPMRLRKDSFIKWVVIVFFYPIILLSQNGGNSEKCRDLAIQGAQTAHLSNLFSQDNFLNDLTANAGENTDTALFYIEQTIHLLDSAIILASDSDAIAVAYAHVARNYAVDTYQSLKQWVNSNYKTKIFTEEAAFNAQNATVDAYHASMYFSRLKKPEKKEEKKPEERKSEKPVTKLDIDQTLFTLLNEELREKKETNTQEIGKLKEALLKTKDAARQTKLKNQIKALELNEKEIEKKSNDTREKLVNINKLINERDKAQQTDQKNEETVFTKSVVKTNEEWNKQVKLDEELPEKLIYQVQLGVFKNNALPDVFKGLTPIYGKTTDNGVCYSTGLFEKMADAKEAKLYVQQMGLADAFIVAYYNKKKITMAEAAKLEKK